MVYSGGIDLLEEPGGYRERGSNNGFRVPSTVSLDVMQGLV
jgi:hypothetical protein